MSRGVTKDPVEDAYAKAEEEEARVVRLKDLIAEAKAQGRATADLQAFAEILVRKASDLRRAADMLSGGSRH